MESRWGFRIRLIIAIVISGLLLTALIYLGVNAPTQKCEIPGCAGQWTTVVAQVPTTTNCELWLDALRAATFNYRKINASYPLQMADLTSDQPFHAYLDIDGAKVGPFQPDASSTVTGHGWTVTMMTVGTDHPPTFTCRRTR